MSRLPLTDEEWELIAEVVPEPAPTGRPRHDLRQVLDGILWVLRTGSPWRDVPEEFGTWKACCRMFDTWNAEGTLADILHRPQAAFVRSGHGRELG
jgi:transposase